MLTKTEIVSQSIVLLGHRPIITLENPDDLTLSASQAFDLLLPSVLSAGNWRFACQIQQLSLSPIIPPTQTNWENVYYLPSGYLKNIRIIPDNYVYEIYANSLIYCNWGTQGPWFMEFIFQPPIEQLPPWFTEYFTWEIATRLALSNAQKPDYYAVLEKTRLLKMGMAMAIDAQNRPQYSQVNIPSLNKRVITGIIGPSAG
jgi:hypothetical protein